MKRLIWWGTLLFLLGLLTGLLLAMMPGVVNNPVAFWPAMSKAS